MNERQTGIETGSYTKFHSRPRIRMHIVNRMYMRLYYYRSTCEASLGTVGAERAPLVVWTAVTFVLRLIEILACTRNTLLPITKHA